MKTKSEEKKEDPPKPPQKKDDDWGDIDIGIDPEDEKWIDDLISKETTRILINDLI